MGQTVAYCSQIIKTIFYRLWKKIKADIMLSSLTIFHYHDTIMAVTVCIPAISPYNSMQQLSSNTDTYVLWTII